MKKLHELLSIARYASGLSLRELEKKSGISNALLSQMETGHVKKPSFENVVKFARACRVSITYFADAIK